MDEKSSRVPLNPNEASKTQTSNNTEKGTKRQALEDISNRCCSNQEPAPKNVKITAFPVRQVGIHKKISKAEDNSRKATNRKVTEQSHFVDANILVKRKEQISLSNTDFILDIKIKRIEEPLLKENLDRKQQKKNPLEDVETHEKLPTSRNSFISNNDDDNTNGNVHEKESVHNQNDQINRCLNDLHDNNVESTIIDSNATKEDVDMMELDGATCEESTIRNDIINIDSNVNDSFYCGIYANDIYELFRVLELKIKPLENYMENQREITPHMRSILVDWLIEVAMEYGLTSDTLYLTINYLDRYLSKRTVSRGNLQLLGIVCMLIAAKIEEVFPPKVEDFAYIADNTYRKEEITRMEASVLNRLDFCLAPPTIKLFLRRFLRAADAEFGEVAMLANYLCELSLLQYTLLKYSPSVIAASAVCLALHSCKLAAWTPTLEHYTGLNLISSSALRSCIEDLWKIQIEAKTSSFQVVREKYSHTAFFRVSTFSPAENLPFC